MVMPHGVQVSVDGGNHRFLKLQCLADLQRYCNWQAREIAKGVVAWRWKFSAMGIFTVDRSLVFSVILAAL